MKTNRTTEERLNRLERNRRTQETFVNIGFAILSICIIGYLIFNAITLLFTPEKNETIQFEVIGITNSTNATTLVQIHYECIKFCETYRSSSYDLTRDCWTACSTLGKEEK